MQTQPTVSFDGVAVDDLVRTAALTHIDHLERLCPEILGCHVVLTQPHRHRRRDRLWSARIDLVLPGVDIIVNRTHPRDHSHEDPLVTLSDAFASARRRLEVHRREHRGDVGDHRPHVDGTILRVVPQAGYGFIKASDGREIYFQATSITGCGFHDVLPGMPVRFTVEDGDDGSRATWVHVTDRSPATATATPSGEVIR